MKEKKPACMDMCVSSLPFRAGGYYITGALTISI